MRAAGLRYNGETFAWECACPTRRGFLRGLGATLAAAPIGAFAGTPPPRAIDTHHHIYPPKYTAENLQRIVADIAIAPGSFYTSWSPQAALEKMDRAGVSAAINSMSSPGVWFNDGEAGRARARECNEFGAELIADYPGRFGMFAAIPLPDIEGSLREIAYALDTLKLDGIGLLTSYDGKLLGHPAFAPVLLELNRRKTVVFVHPTMSCCGNVTPGVRSATLEFPMDTTRVIVDLVMSGGFAAYPDIRFIFSHGGGMLLPIVNRVQSLLNALKPEDRGAKVPGGLEATLRRSFYDLASVGFNRPAMAGLRELLPVSQMLYGSDEPFNSTVALTESVGKLGFSEAEMAAVRRGNALGLFPRLG